MLTSIPEWIRYERFISIYFAMQRSSPAPSPTTAAGFFNFLFALHMAQHGGNSTEGEKECSEEAGREEGDSFEKKWEEKNGGIGTD